MKKLIYSFTALCLSIFAFSSCDGFLDAENKSAGSDANEYFATEEGLETLKNQAYFALRPLVTTTDYNEWGTDIYTTGRSSDPSGFHTYSSLTAEDESIKSFYINAYKMINYANGILFYNENSKYADEAKFLRNYGYYLLTQQFGAVPYITSYINSGERSYPRTDLADIYSSMIDELKALYVSPNLPAESVEGVANKRAVAALLAKVYLAAGWDLQTKLTNAEKGQYEILSTEYFTQAASWAETAINNQGLSLSFAEKWSPFNENNAEEIFSVQYRREGYAGDILTGGHGLQHAFGHSYGDATNGMKSCRNQLIPSAKAAYLWDKGDERWQATFMSIMYNAKKDDKGVHWGTEGYFAAWNAPQDTAKLNIVLAYFPHYADHDAVIKWVENNQSRFVGTGYANRTGRVFVMSDPMLQLEIKENGSIGSNKTVEYNAGRETSNAGLCVKKYDDPQTEQASSSSQCYRDIVVLHLSDMYLVAAEAYLMKGEKSLALEKLNAVRARAKATVLNSFADYKAGYTHSESFDINELDIILDERARELFGENEGRWVDLRRTKQLVRYNIEFNEYTSLSGMTGADGQIKWLRPIPAAEISTNTGIGEENQNPGYKSSITDEL